MKTLEELRSELKELLTKNKAAVEKACGADATDADIEALEKSNADVAKIERQIAAITASKASQASAAKPVDAETVPAAVEVKLSKEAKIGLIIRGLIAQHKGEGPIGKSLEDNGFGSVAKELLTTTPSKGGVTIPVNLSETIIELLRPNSAFQQGQPTPLTLPNGNITIPRQDSGVRGSYVAEATDIGVEEPALGSMSFSSKKLAVIVPISNELLSWSPVDMEAFVKGDMSLGLGQTQDLNLLRGDGTNGAPVGITAKAGVYAFAANATGSIQAIEADLARAQTYMDLALVPKVRRRWIMSPRTLQYLSALRDGNGNLAYPTLSTDNPTLRRVPVLETTQIPVNLGAGTNATEIYLIEFSEVFFAQPPGTNLEFAISNEATYKVGGVAFSAFQRDVTLIRAITRHDTDIRRLGAVVKITGVTWGA